jgi:hypothetical protein
MCEARASLYELSEYTGIGLEVGSLTMKDRREGMGEREVSDVLVLR